MARLLLLIALLSMASVLVSAHTHSECGIAETSFGMCIPYVLGDDPKLHPECCGAVDSLKLQTSNGGGQNYKEEICDCLRNMVAGFGKVDSARLAGLAGSCGIDTNVIPASLTFDCSTIA